MASAETTSPSQSVTYPHLTFRDGVARIGDTRFKVKHLAAAHHFREWDAEELMRQFPVLKPVEVYAALTYFYDHQEEILSELEADRREGERLAGAQTPSREELLARLKARQQG